MTLFSNGSGGSGNPSEGQGAGNSGSGSGGQNAGGSGGAGSGGQGDGGNAGASAAAGGGQGGAGGTGNASWRDSLPSDLKAHAALQSFSSVENLAKSYLHAQSMVGKKGHVLPTDKSTPEDWGATWDALGRPALDKYEVKAPEGVDPEFINRFKQTVHKEGLLPKQAQAILDWSRSEAKAQSEAQVAQAKAEGTRQMGELRQEYGKDWDGAVRRAVRAAEHVSPEFRNYLEKTGLGNDVQVIKALEKLGKLLGEDTMRGDGGAGNMGMDNSQIDAEISQIRNQPEFVSFEDSPKKRQLNDRLSQLYQMKHSA